MTTPKIEVVPPSTYPYSRLFSSPSSLSNPPNTTPIPPKEIRTIKAITPKPSTPNPPLNPPIIPANSNLQSNRTVQSDRADQSDRAVRSNIVVEPVQSNVVPLSGGDYSLSFKLHRPVSELPIKSQECVDKGRIPLIAFSPGVRKEIKKETVIKKEDETEIVIREKMLPMEEKVVSVVEDELLKDNLVRNLVINAKEEVEELREVLNAIMMEAKRGQISMKSLYDMEIGSSKIHNLLSESIKLLS
jgi:hypothetical protein